jgi:hypothetical protein
MLLSSATKSTAARKRTIRRHELTYTWLNSRDYHKRFECCRSPINLTLAVSGNRRPCKDFLCLCMGSDPLFVFCWRHTPGLMLDFTSQLPGLFAKFRRPGHGRFPAT